MKLKKVLPIVALLLIAVMAGCKKDDTGTANSYGDLIQTRSIM